MNEYYELVIAIKDLKAQCFDDAIKIIHGKPTPARMASDTAEEAIRKLFIDAESKIQTAINNFNRRQRNREE